MSQTPAEVAIEVVVAVAVAVVDSTRASEAASGAAAGCWVVQRRGHSGACKVLLLDVAVVAAAAVVHILRSVGASSVRWEVVLRAHETKTFLPPKQNQAVATRPKEKAY